MFAAIVWRALIVGLLAGIVLTAAQSYQVVPLIIEAESYEQANPAQEGHGHHHGHHHGDEHEEWIPHDGAERTFYTGLSNVLAGIGFALVLLSFIALRNQGGWKRGLLWGLAGFTVFFAAPVLSGLYPGLPGTVVASLDARQVWWWATVVSTAAGLWLMVFGGKLPWRGIGLLLFAAPFVIGAPAVQMDTSLVPEALLSAFLPATAIASAIFWLVLGSLAGLLWKQSEPANQNGTALPNG